MRVIGKTTVPLTALIQSLPPRGNAASDGRAEWCPLKALSCAKRWPPCGGTGPLHGAREVIVEDKEVLLRLGLPFNYCAARDRVLGTSILGTSMPCNGKTRVISPFLCHFVSPLLFHLSCVISSLLCHFVSPVSSHLSFVISSLLCHFVSPLLFYLSCIISSLLCHFISPLAIRLAASSHLSSVISSPLCYFISHVSSHLPCFISSLLCHFIFPVSFYFTFVVLSLLCHFICRFDLPFVISSPLGHFISPWSFHLPFVISSPLWHPGTLVLSRWLARGVSCYWCDGTTQFRWWDTINQPQSRDVMGKLTSGQLLLTWWDNSVSETLWRDVMGKLMSVPVVFLHLFELTQK